jgi:hypothetical protein
LAQAAPHGAGMESQLPGHVVHPRTAHEQKRAQLMPPLSRQRRRRVVP